MTTYSLSYRLKGTMFNHTVHKTLKSAEKEARKLILKYKFATYVQIWEHKRGKEQYDRIFKWV